MVADESLLDELVARLGALDPDDVVDDEALVVRCRPTPTRVGHPPIVVVSGGASFDVGVAPLLIGRATAGNDVDVAVASPLVSRRHATVWSDGGALLCRDLGSTNGTVRVRDAERSTIGTAPAALLVAGDVLVTADDVELLTVGS